MSTALPAFDEELHRSGIGSSRAAACVGVSPYESQLEAYQYFVDAQQRPQRPIDPEKAFFGHAMESVICEAFTRETGLRVRRNKRTFRSKEFPFLIATPDAFVVGERAVLECKTAGLRTIQQWGKEGTDEVPINYLVQVAHQLIVTDYTKAHLAVLLGANDLRVYAIGRDPELEGLLTARLAEFWRRVQERDPPPPASLDDAALAFPRDRGTAANATPEAVDAHEALHGLKAEMKALQAGIEQRELELKLAMGEHAELLGPAGKPLATWRTQEAKRVDIRKLREHYPAIAQACEVVSSTRVFRLI